MPRSKRARVVHLSKVTKKGREHSQALFSKVQESVEAYAYIYVFRVANMRNAYLKELRSELADSRIFFGSTKLLSRALGRSAADEIAPGTAQLAPYLHGAVGLIFSPRPPAELAAVTQAFLRADYARTGARATRDFTIPEGIVYASAGELEPAYDSPFPPGQEPALRALGVPTRLLKGKVTLDAEHTVCTVGEELNAKQTALLKMFGIQMATFQVALCAVWKADEGRVDELDGAKELAAEMDVDGDADADDDGGVPLMQSE